MAGVRFSCTNPVVRSSRPEATQSIFRQLRLLKAGLTFHENLPLRIFTHSLIFVLPQKLYFAKSILVLQKKKLIDLIYQSSLRLIEKSVERRVSIVPSVRALPLFFTSCVIVVHLLHPYPILAAHQMPLSLLKAAYCQHLRPLPILRYLPGQTSGPRVSGYVIGGGWTRVPAACAQPEIRCPLSAAAPHRPPGPWGELRSLGLFPFLPFYFLQNTCIHLLFNYKNSRITCKSFRK